MIEREVEKEVTRQMISSPYDSLLRNGTNEELEKWGPNIYLRSQTRKILHYAGVYSNPGWTDRDIVEAVREKVGLDPLSEWSNDPEADPHEVYRDHLVSSLSEAGIELKEPVTEIPNILKGLADHLLS